MDEIKVSDIKVKYQVLIKLDGGSIGVYYFDNSTTAKEFAEAYNRRLPGTLVTPGAEAVYNGAFPLDG